WRTRRLNSIDPARRSYRPAAAGSHAGKSSLRSYAPATAATMGHSIDGHSRHAPTKLTPRARIAQPEVAARNRIDSPSGNGRIGVLLRPPPSGTTAAPGSRAPEHHRLNGYSWIQ